MTTEIVLFIEDVSKPATPANACSVRTGGHVEVLADVPAVAVEVLVLSTFGGILIEGKKLRREVVKENKSQNGTNCYWY